MGIPLDKASLLALFLETLFYGVFLTLYCLTLFILLRKSGINQQLLIPVATMLLCIATAVSALVTPLAESLNTVAPQHLIVDFVRVLEAFVFDADKMSADAYYSNLAAPLEYAKTALYVTQTAPADCVFFRVTRSSSPISVWRCYVLNDRSLFVAVPGLIVLCTNAVTGYIIVWSLSQANSSSTVFTTAHAWITTFFTLTMITSFTCTTLIAWRIYRTRRFMSGGFAAYLPILIVIVESGAIYATGVLSILVTYLSGSNGQYAVLDTVSPIMGIVFCLIILQVHFQIGNKSLIARSLEPRGVITGSSDSESGVYAMWAGA
ncbi:uncharacterized protein BJ212DRAFT_1298350 [Suillus subaureus]|uniref:Uncharacterized protein n=1 Tax=Suillus subaureus TaxID=48587 RepID=A0A9P7JFD4_9AGAM|nr:uncharacterized protein BJ212DRAFT_1298350 [Suillus subaureus]KAG1819079.1 hypothetical protein BJ212DRAFT_1298350 [Suillus subaureus]